ncbi:hypothetical protein ABES03_08405 [Neobacillus rhizosphaerae]|uniref:hypothetical protein n=1 Tax=Neobacillus rhizosphaerae TaxID=2880965 RepID=UPI003D2745EC
MTYEVASFQELIEIMASCERLGLFYVVQKDFQEREKWFGRTEQKLVYRLQVVQYVEEVGEHEQEVPYRGQSESENSEAHE